MAQIIGLPKLSPTMEEGVLVKWAKREGDKVSPGDLVAEVETDKANMDFNIEDEGTLLKFLVKEGETVKLGAPVAILGKPGEDIAGLISQAGGAAPAQNQGAPAAQNQAAPAQKQAAPTAQNQGAQNQAARSPNQNAAQSSGQNSAQNVAQNQGVQGAANPGQNGAVQGAQAQQAQAAQNQVLHKQTAPANGQTGNAANGQVESGGKAVAILASPLAKSLAVEYGINLRQVRGTGPGGRIVERDVKAAAQGGQANAGQANAGQNQAANEANPQTWHDEEPVTTDNADDFNPRALAIIPPTSLSVPGASDEYVDKPLSNMRRTIASRLTAAKRDVPHFRLHTEVDAGPLVDFRKRLNALIGENGRVSINDLLLKGAALALRRVPEVNAAFVGEAIRYYTRVHIGVAVALEQGLLTPVIRNADLKGIGVISAEVRQLVERAKRREIKAHEITGSTFTVSNLGMFPVDQFDAIINPPESAILAVGRIVKKPVVEDERIVIGERLTLTLSCDHRVVDGALGAKYIAALVEILERPESLAL